MNTLHAHVSTAAADCDGPIYRSWVETMNMDELNEHALAEDYHLFGGVPISDFSDIHFMDRVFTNQCSPYAVGRGMRITVTDEGFEYHQDTDEGYRRGEVRWCHDDCDTDERSQRDVYAERMNY